MRKSIDPMSIAEKLGVVNRGPRPQPSSASMSFQLAIPGRLLSSRARLRFTNRRAVCSKLILPVEDFSSNGEQCLNWLSQPRGQAQIDLIVTFQKNLPKSARTQLPLLYGEPSFI